MTERIFSRLLNEPRTLIPVPHSIIKCNHNTMTCASTPRQLAQRKQPWCKGDVIQLDIRIKTLTCEQRLTLSRPLLKTARLTPERHDSNDLYVTQQPTGSTQPLTSEQTERARKRAIRPNNDGDSSRSIQGLSHYGWRV